MVAAAWWSRVSSLRSSCNGTLVIRSVQSWRISVMAWAVARRSKCQPRSRRFRALHAAGGGSPVAAPSRPLKVQTGVRWNPHQATDETK